MTRFAVCLFLAAWLSIAGQAAVVNGSLQAITGSAAPDAEITFTPMDAPWSDGINLVLPGALVTRSVNGLFSVTLLQGSYRVDIGGRQIGFIRVPAGGDSYNISTISGVFTYLGESGGGTGDVTASGVLTNGAPLVGAGGSSIAATNVAGFRAAVGLAIGTDVQAWDVDLDLWAGINPAAKQDSDTDLAALAGLSSTGLIARTGSGTAAARSIVAGSSKIAVANGSGTSGNPTIDLGTLTAGDIPSGVDAAKIADGAVSNAEFQRLDGVTSAIQSQIDGKQAADSDLAAVAGLSGTGLVARTGSGTAAARTIQGATVGHIIVTDGDGVGGNPQIAVDVPSIDIGEIAGGIDASRITSGTIDAARLPSTWDDIDTITVTNLVVTSNLVSAAWAPGRLTRTDPTTTNLTTVTHTGIAKGDGSQASAGSDYVAPGAATGSGLTMATARLLGRTTASSGAIEEISIGSGLSLSGGSLSATGGGGSIDDTAFASSWNGVTGTGPSKNAVYDWGHIFDSDDDGKVNVLDMGAGLVKTDSGGVVSAASAGTDYLAPAAIDDTAYDATSWNGVTTSAPSKNAVRDKIELLQPLDADLTSIAGGISGVVYGSGNGNGFAAATSGQIQAALGQVYQGTNANLTSWSALAPSAKQDADADLDDLADGSLTGSKVGSGINADNITTGTVLDARIDAAIARDAEVSAAYQPLDADLTDLADGSLTGSKVGSGIDDDNVSFDDADSLWTATTIGAALEELNDSINAGVPNGAGSKVHWSQLLGVPAGFADGTDDGAGGAAIENEAFGSAWNGDTTNGAAKDNLYDWGHIFDTDDDGKVNVLDMGAGLVKTDSGGVVSAASAGSDYVAPGAVTTSGLTMATDKLLGRDTASSGAVEEIGLGDGMTITSGNLRLPQALGTGDSPTFAGISLTTLTTAILNVTKAIQSYQGSLTHAGTVTLDFDGSTTLNSLSLTGNVTFALSNLATNRTYRLWIKNPQATNITVTFPSNVTTNFFGGAPSTTLTSGKTAMWSMEAWGTGNADVLSAWAEN